MSTNNPHGFTEHRHLGGSVCPATRWYKVKADGASGSHQKFPGDPVVLVSGNSVARIAVAATAAALPVVGVIRACFNSDKRPLTFNQPNTGGGFIPASTAGFVEVNVDPFQTYLVNTDATVVSTLIGQYADVTANTPSTAAGRSGFSIEVATGVNTAANTAPFQIISIGDDNLDGITGGESNQNVEVRIMQHAFLNFNKAR
jgi:hypothetical protein